MDKIQTELSDLEKKGLRRKLRKVTRISARECILDGKPCIDFSSNNYLALADDPRIVEESINWTRKFGAGSGASRLISGTLAEYSELEERIAAWKNSEAALIVGSGYLANIGIIPALTGREWAIFADKLNHNSLVNACLLSRSEFHRYAHNDIKNLNEIVMRQIFDVAAPACPAVASLRRRMPGAPMASTPLCQGYEGQVAVATTNATPKTDALHEILEKSESKNKMLVSDTVFSMDGDLADIDGIANFAEKTGALVYLDEAHATGVFGKKGEGLAGNLKGSNVITMGTFSKALGSYGAYVSCSREIKEYLINKCQTFIYSTALPPAVFGAISAAVELVQTPEFSQKRTDLLKKSAFLASEINKIGFETGKTGSPIIPVIIGGNKEVLRISQFLLDKGIFAVAVRPPTVPEGSARLRISLNCAHNGEDTSRLLEVLQTCKQL